MSKLFKDTILFLAVVIMTLIVTSCGDRVHDYHHIVDQHFEGYHRLTNNSSIEFITAKDGDVNIITTGQLLISENPQNGSYATHPSINRVGLEPVGGVLSFVQNFNYTSGQDVEEDVSGGNITGSHMTDVLIQQLPNDRIRITIKIYSDALNNNPNDIVAERVWESI